MILFEFKTEVNRHWGMKNRNIIRRAGNKMFLGKPQKLLNDKNKLILQLKSAWKNKPIITTPIHAQFTFYFADFFTKKGHMNLKLGDLSNLYQLPEDCLQIAGIIKDDSLIMAHDGSRKLPSTNKTNWLEIKLKLFEN